MPPALSRHVAMLTVAGAPLRVARVARDGIEVPLTVAAREQLVAMAEGGQLEAELVLVGPDWEAAYVLPFALHLQGNGQAWLAFGAVDAALARALDRFGVAEEEVPVEVEEAPRRTILPESEAVLALTRARRAGVFEAPAPAAPAVLPEAARPYLLYAVLAASMAMLLLALALL